MIFLYRLFYYFISYFLSIISNLLPEDLKKWISLRSYKLPQVEDLKHCIWFHAASGEIEYCKSIIREIKQKNPEQKIIVSYSSPSAERLFKNISSDVDLFFPLPWDHPGKVKELFQILKPKVLVFSRTDFWPELIHQAKSADVKMAVVSYIHNPNAGLLQKIIRIRLLANFNLISCTDEFSATELKNHLNHVDVYTDGDTRFDQVFFRLNGSSRLKMTSAKKIMVFGSTWPEDEKIIFNCLNSLKSKMNFVLSPHEVNIENIEALTANLKQLQLSFVKLSDLFGSSNEVISDKTLQVTLDKDVLLIDRIGFLADCYRDADLAFVGGSFRARVHSVMEPLCCGLQVIVGPYIQNSPEAIRYRGKFVHCVQNASEFLTASEGLSSINKKELILNEMALNKNATKVVTDRILKITF